MQQVDHFFRTTFSCVFVAFMLLFTAASNAQNNENTAVPKSEDNSKVDYVDNFIGILRYQDSGSLQNIKDNWHRGLVPMAIEVLSYGGTKEQKNALSKLIREELGAPESSSISEWYKSLWNTESFEADPSYHSFKAALYENIDQRFARYFKGREQQTRIRLDEVQWGGVQQDGIPPLHNPEMVGITEANYLKDDNIVFGIEINGDARAYPKRILAWHEMFTDTIGGVDIAGVYCTLCGAVIPFRSEHNGQKHTLGTSGFLYRSNKLMYDKATQSLWSTTRGTPVIGPLVGKGIQLDYEAVVTTTWGEWKKRHPETTVLSLNTGHSRDYGEGVAYNEYFSDDTLMFRTPFDDNRLQNKQEILALRFPAAPNQQLAIDTEFLSKNPLYESRIGAQKFIVLTDKSGANRVFDPQDKQFTRYDGESTITDSNGGKWTVNESNLIAANGQDKLGRLPYHRAFWFGWRAAFPETKLIK